MTELFFKIQFAKNFLIYVFGVFTFSFCYCFRFLSFCYFSFFIHKIILLNWFLPFICISYPLKVSIRSKSLNFLQSIAFLCLILFLMFACNNFNFRAYVTMIYWMSTEVLLNLVAPLNLAAESGHSFLDLEQINVFWTFGFDYVSIVFDSLNVNRSLPELYFLHSI